MVRCSIKSCKSDSLMKIVGLSFHSFPNKPEVKKKWIAATGRPNWFPKESSRICSQRFDSNLIIKKGSKTYLYPNAVPKMLSESENDGSPVMVASSSGTLTQPSAESSRTNMNISYSYFWLKTLFGIVRFKLYGGSEHRTLRCAERNIRVSAGRKGTWRRGTSPRALSLTRTSPTRLRL